MKIKDLSRNQILDGWKLKEGYIVSEWKKGFWVVDDFLKYQNGGGKVSPVFFGSPEEMLEMEITPPQE